MTSGTDPRPVPESQNLRDALAELQAIELARILQPYGFTRDLTEVRAPDALGVTVGCDGLEFTVMWECPDAGETGLGLARFPADTAYAVIRDVAVALAQAAKPAASAKATGE